ncbi:DedA family protein [Microbacterium sp. 179-I 3D4 NHS]|uniref:DedA family protein n=1 Tax=Microbacterium sp. 179-I 3D4 NHS TaxID=3142381 RepID=UPI0039A2F632
MDALTDFILLAVHSPWLPLVLFLVTVVDGFFPPVPSETVLVAAAAVSTSAGADVLVLGGVAALGAAVGDNVAFAIGRRVGTTSPRWRSRPRLAAAFERARAALDERSASLILGARYVPVGRVAVNMSAGMLQFPWRRFLPLSLVAGASWSALSLAIGVLAGSWVADQPMLGAGIGVALALTIGVVIDRFARIRRGRAEATRLAG